MHADLESSPGGAASDPPVMKKHHAPDPGLPPLQRVKRAPGGHPRKGKRGGLNKQGKMIE